MERKEMSKEEFYALAKNLNRYKVQKKLSGELSYASIGDTYDSKILYERGYDIKSLVKEGFLIQIGEPYQFQIELVGKNVKSVYCYCPECQSFGINTPLNNECGNCGYSKCVTYYDAETINNYLTTTHAK